MECRISINLVKEGVGVKTFENIAHAEGHPGIKEFFTDLLDDIVSLIKTITFSNIFNASLGTVGCIAELIAPGVVAPVAIAPATIYAAYIETEAELKKSSDIWNDIIGSSDYYYSASDEVKFDESDEFDEIQIFYHAWSEDNITKASPAFVSPQAYSQGIFKREDTVYVYGVSIKTSALESGKYPFIFGAMDDGWKNDVATFSYLTLEWRKKPKPNSKSLRQLSESIDPPSPFRSLKNVARILDVYPPSLRESCKKQAVCLSIQQAPLTIFEHNAALLPEHLSIDKFGIDRVYKGTDRNSSIESFIQYLMVRQPDIVGFCEFWVPKEREYIRNRLSEIYPLHSAFYAEGPNGDAPGFQTMMDGGLLLLSKYPIMARDQIIYSACAGEDCLSAKGAIYAGILVPGNPSLINVFLTHTQSCDPETPLPDAGPCEGCWEKLKVCQIKQLKSFVRSKADQGPCIVMGDFNLGYDFNEIQYCNLTTGLVNEIGTWMKDCWEKDSNGNICLKYDVWSKFSDHKIDVFYPGIPKSNNTDNIEWDYGSPDWKYGRTNGGEKGFELNTKCLWNKKERLDQTVKNEKGEETLIGSRIDYIFGFPSSDGHYRISFDNCRVLMILNNEEKDSSDHYGLLATVKSICERKEGFYDQ